MDFYLPTLNNPRLKDFKLEDTGLIIFIYNKDYTQDCSHAILINKTTGEADLYRYTGPKLDIPVTDWVGVFKNEQEFNSLLERLAQTPEWENVIDFGSGHKASFYTPTLDHLRLHDFKRVETINYVFMHDYESLRESYRILRHDKRTGHTQILYSAGSDEAPFLSEAWSGILNSKAHLDEVLSVMLEQSEW